MAEDKLVSKLRRRQYELEQIRAPWESDWQVIAEYVQPRREFLTTDQINDQGFRAGRKVYDGTAGGALRLLADGLLGYMVSPRMKWMRLRFGDEKIEQIPGALEWLQDIEALLYTVLENSTFYGACHQYFMDGGSIGTATIHIKEDLAEGKPVYTVRHPVEIYIAHNENQVIDTVHRKYEMSARNALRAFGDELDNDIQEAAKNPNETDHMYKFVHAVWPNEDQVYGNIGWAGKKYMSCHFRDYGNKTQKFSEGDGLMQKGGYEEMPYAIWRWRLNSNETYGRSPAHDCLVDIIKSNQMGKDMLNAAQMAINGPVNAPKEAKGSIRITPGGVNYYKDASRIISEVRRGINYPIGADREDKIQEIIKQHFRVEFFLMLAQAERQMTATEIIGKQGEKAAIMGATTSQLEAQALAVLIDRTYQIEMEAGRLPPPPAALQEFGGADIEIDFIGPLAQAQRRLYRTQGLSLALEQTVPIMQAQPHLFDVVKWEEVIREQLDANGMPAKFIRDKREYKKLMEQRAQQEEEARKMAMAAELAEAAPKLNQRVQPGSMLEEAQEGLAG